MLVCVECKQKMTCVKNGKGVRFGHAHVYPGDMYECPKCGKQVINTTRVAIYDPEQKTDTIQMEDE